MQIDFYGSLFTFPDDVNNDTCPLNVLRMRHPHCDVTVMAELLEQCQNDVDAVSKLILESS